VTYTLGANIENLGLTGGAAINGTGNALANALAGNGAANVLSGGGGNDWLDGGAGADALVGGTGDDAYVVDDAGDVVIENADEGIDGVQAAVTYTLGANIENLGLTGGAAINGTGNALANGLAGNGAANVLSGGGGNDWLDGGAGADALIGGTGDDAYAVGDAGDVVTEYANEGDDTVIVYGSFTYTLAANVENGLRNAGGTLNGNTANNVLIGSYQNDSLYGVGGDDIIHGGDGGDWIVGGAGADQLNGGAGLDWAVYSGAGQAVSINLALNTASGGDAQGDTFSGIEMLYGSSHADTLIGDATGNTLYGGGGNDLLDGGAGSDNAYYYNDTGGVVVDLAAGTATDAYGGTDTLLNMENITGSNTGNDLLYGNAADNVISGGGGNDNLYGRGGNDTVKGGVGNDTLYFYRGDGADSWTDTDSTVGNLDIARFGADIAHDQIWFRKVGNDLETSVIGTADKALVKNWYAGSANHIERFESGNGKVLLDSQIQALVDAMAAFAPPASGQTTLPTNYQQALAPVLAANWQ
ncbi:MAG: calcium-binding protein, partial [Rhodocyclaceae bacterium]|nr:calcium-binding protein [Rhodocyclaceae bacterium]